MQLSRLISLSLAGSYAFFLSGTFVPDGLLPPAPRVIALHLTGSPPPMPETVSEEPEEPFSKMMVLEAQNAPDRPSKRDPLPEPADQEPPQQVQTQQVPSIESPEQESPGKVVSSDEGARGLEASELPPKPDDDEAPPIVMGENPGGRVLILAVRIGADGKALDTRILVPSSDTVGDMGYALAASQLYQPDINPPIEPGKSRWITLRIEYPDPALNSRLP